MTAMTDHIPVVETERLRLRAPKLDDLAPLTAFYASNRSQWVGGPLDARAAHRNMMSIFGSWALRGHGLWFVAERNSDAFIGWAGIIYAPSWHEPELGWTVLEEAQGKGIAFEAASTARRYAAQHLGHDGVISYVAPNNTRSATLARRLGAVLEREDTFQDQQVHVYRHPKEAA